MKAKIKLSSGSVKIDPVVLDKAKEHCKKKGILISFFATEAVDNHLKKEKSK